MPKGGIGHHPKPVSHHSTAMPIVPRSFSCHLGLLATVIFTAVSGCKPAPSAMTAQQTPLPDGNAPRQPTANDFQAFFQGMLPATVKVSEVKMDAPTRIPNASPASNIWALEPQRLR